MKLAKPFIDVGLFTNDLAPTLTFWREKVGAAADQILKIGPGLDQHRADLRGSVLKINHSAESLPSAPASGYRELLVAAPGEARRVFIDPTGAAVALVPPGEDGVTQIGMRIVVRDLDAHRRFYGEALGLPEEAPGRFRAGESLILLEQGEAAAANSDLSAPGWRYVTFQVFKVDEEYATALGHGAVSAREPVTLGGGMARIAMVRDPDGSWVELLQRAPVGGSLD